MKRLTHRRLSPATLNGEERSRNAVPASTAPILISCIALFVSLGGVSYGVSTGFIDTREIKDETIRSKDVRNNEIRTQDLRNNEVRGRDIRNSTVIGRDVGFNSLTGSDILESSLGPVPQADTLDGVDSTRFVRADNFGFAAVAFGAAGSPAPGEPAAQFDVDPLGYTHLQGVLAAGGGAGALGILPAGSRPAAVSRFAVYSDPAGLVDGDPAPALLRVGPDGQISSVGPADAGDQFALDGITFRVGG